MYLYYNAVKFGNSKPVKVFLLVCTQIYTNIDRCPKPLYKKRAFRNVFRKK